jgi:hypothetical protein
MSTAGVIIMSSCLEKVQLAVERLLDDWQVPR